MVEKVKAGQSIQFKATEWNQIAEATNYVNTTRARGGGPIETSRNWKVNGSDIILGVNNTGAVIEQFDAVIVGDATPDPTNSEWHQKLAVDLTIPTGDGCESVAIAQEGFGIGEFGRIMVSGVSPARVDLQDSLDDIATTQNASATLKSRGSTQSGNVGGRGCELLYSDGATWGVVRIGQFPSCHATQYLGTLDGAIASDDDPLEATVDGLVALNGKATTASSVTAANHFAWDGEDDAKAMIVWDDAGDRWVLIQVAC